MLDFHKSEDVDVGYSFLALALVLVLTLVLERGSDCLVIHVPKIS